MKLDVRIGFRQEIAYEFSECTDHRPERHFYKSLHEQLARTNAATACMGEGMFDA